MFTWVVKNDTVFQNYNLGQKLPNNSWFSPRQFRSWSRGYGDVSSVKSNTGGMGGGGLKIIKNKLSGIFLSGIVCKTFFFLIRYNFFLWGITGLSVCLQCVCLLSYGNADNKFSIILICACIYIYIYIYISCHKSYIYIYTSCHKYILSYHI